MSKRSRELHHMGYRSRPYEDGDGFGYSTTTAAAPRGDGPGYANQYRSDDRPDDGGRGGGWDGAKRRRYDIQGSHSQRGSSRGRAYDQSYRRSHGVDDKQRHRRYDDYGVAEYYYRGRDGDMHTPRSDSRRSYYHERRSPITTTRTATTTSTTTGTSTSDSYRHRHPYPYPYQIQLPPPQQQYQQQYQQRHHRHHHHHHHNDHQRHHRYSPERYKGRYDRSYGRSRRKYRDERPRYGREERERGMLDDEEGHIMFRLGSDLTERFKILKFMGKGTFAKVVECWDRRDQRRVAVKIVRAVSKYTEAAEIEIDVLKDIREKDPDNRHSNCIHYISSFRYRDHICLVFPLYGKSLYDFIKRNRYRGFGIKHVRELAYNILVSIAFIHSFDLIHTDLKPENILLVNSDYDIVELPDDKVPASNSRSRESSIASTSTSRTSRTNSSRVSEMEYMVPRSTDLRTIDFGSATYDYQHHSSIISTRHYRAPEVVLSLGWSFPADIWSVGCIFVELLTGSAMFQTHENREHLAMMEKTLGILPKSMTLCSRKNSKKYFTKYGELNWPRIASNQSSVAFVEKLKPLHVLCGLRHPNSRSTANNSVDKVDDSDGANDDDDETLIRNDFYDLCRQMLLYDPQKRVTAREALRHIFFAPIRERRQDRGQF